jgi:hypothetical protein
LCITAKSSADATRLIKNQIFKFPETARRGQKKEQGFVAQAPPGASRKSESCSGAGGKKARFLLRDRFGALVRRGVASALILHLHWER